MLVLNSMANKKTTSIYQHGQTLVETVVAIFVMVMGITAALGLANFAFHSSTNVTKQIIAIGLAREGVEAIKNMRDTNWLRAGSYATDCYDFANNTNDGICYKNWLNPGTAGSYDITALDYDKNSHKSFTIAYNPGLDTSPAANNPYWTYTLVSGQPKFGLTFNPTGVSSGGAGAYYTPSGADIGPSGYYRKISVRLEGDSNISAGGPFAAYTKQDPYQQGSGPQYNTDIGPRIHVISQVWWKDKACPDPGDFNYDYPTRGSCRIQLEQYFTNWKNY